MTDALKVKKMWRHANSTATRPVMGNTVKPEDRNSATVEWQKAVERYEESDEAAAAFIRQHISNGQLLLVAACTTTADTWSKICTAHEKPGILSYVIETVCITHIS